MDVHTTPDVTICLGYESEQLAEQHKMEHR